MNIKGAPNGGGDVADATPGSTPGGGGGAADGGGSYGGVGGAGRITFHYT